MVYQSVISPSETVKIECLCRVFASTADASLSELSYDWNKTDQYEDTDGLRKNDVYHINFSRHRYTTLELSIYVLVC